MEGQRMSDGLFSHGSVGLGGSIIGALSAWFGLKSKVDRLREAREEDKKSMEEFRKEFQQSIKGISEAHTTALRDVVSERTCTMCQTNNKNQITAMIKKQDDMHEDLTIFVNNFSRRRDDQKLPERR
jgi:uncharacterized protein YeaO (DUF488 family)